jgi:hypothetical protein
MSRLTDLIKLHSFRMEPFDVVLLDHVLDLINNRQERIDKALDLLKFPTGNYDSAEYQKRADEALALLRED